MFIISTVIPSYNAEATIERCLNSVLKQTSKIHEIIIVDDGSTDKTVMIIETFIKNNPEVNIKLFYQPNSGPSTARNLGVQKAEGNIIAFLDADDYWFESKIDTQVKIMMSHPDAVLIGGEYGGNKKKVREYVSEVTFNDLLLSNWYATPTVLVRKHVFETMKFNIDQLYCEDYFLWLQIAFNYKCLYVSEILSESVLERLRYGEMGLSSNMWKMEQGELGNFLNLKRMNYINNFQLFFFSAFSLLKYAIRIVKLFLLKK